jgi:RNase P/RNase MRP subunit POP5
MKTANIAKNVPGVHVPIDDATKQNKQKVLLPTLKEQQRYVVYRIIFVPKSVAFDTNKLNDKLINNAPDKLTDFSLVHNNILIQCNNMLGIFDGAKAGIMSAKYNQETTSGIIRINNDYVDKLKLCLGLIKEINSRKVLVNCIYVSGMLNKAINKMNA